MTQCLISLLCVPEIFGVRTMICGQTAHIDEIFAEFTTIFSFKLLFIPCHFEESNFEKKWRREFSKYHDHTWTQFRYGMVLHAPNFFLKYRHPKGTICWVLLFFVLFLLFCSKIDSFLKRPVQQQEDQFGNSLPDQFSNWGWDLRFERTTFSRQLCVWDLRFERTTFFRQFWVCLTYKRNFQLSLRGVN